MDVLPVVGKGLAKIEKGSRVAIIGGGPAGSFFALYLRRYADENGIQPEITIYQQRDFNQLGTKGCKGCAGVLSASLLKNLEELNLSVPDERIQCKIEHYAVHSPYISIHTSDPEKELGIASIYRGGGPRESHYEWPISFDGWLLNQAQQQGVRVENQRVSRVHLEHRPSVEISSEKLEYDLVVLANGVSTHSIPILGLDYVPPKTRIMAQDELYAGTAQVESRLGKVIHAFLLPHSRLVFGTLVPKGPFINVSVLSSGEQPVSVAEFLNYKIVRDMLPERCERACGCQPRTVIGAARNYYTDRFVAIGDAAASRLYKDGIGSALLTARQAARTVVDYGISRQDFAQYYQPFCGAIDRDNQWGRLLFSLNDRTKESRLFVLTQHRLIGDEQRDTARPQPFTRAAWGMFTGSYRYTSIAWMVFNPASLVKLGTTLFREGLTSMLAKRAKRSQEPEVGAKKVLILGSGFGGIFALKCLVPALRRKEKIAVTIVSDENFFLFSPLLHEVAMGIVETRHVTYPIRRFPWRDRFNFIQASVEKIDLGARKVMTTIGALDFDYLVLALGSVTNLPKFDSAEEKGRMVFTLKTLHDSMLIRNQIIRVFEQASLEKNPERQKQLLTFVVCGAGYTGIQVVTALRDFINHALSRFYQTIDPTNVRVILVEAGGKIGAELHSKLAAYTTKHLETTGIEVRLNSRVTRFWEDRIELNGSEIIPSSTIIWATGVVANPRIAELEANKDSLGRVLVSEYLEVSDVPGVYAVGDCAHFADPRSGQPIPPRAHTAVRQAKVAAHNILADIRGRPKKPYHYSNPAQMVSLGASKAVFRLYGLRLYGFPARLVWLGTYSLLVTGAYNRVRIITDWLLSLVFGRDITLLKLIK